MYRNRLEIEEGVIAAIIDSNAFPIAVNIITAKNFTVPKFAVLFQVAQSLYPTRPIELITLRTELIEHWGDTGIEALDYLNRKRFSVYDSKSVQYWCFMLLQMDISDAYSKELVKWRESRISDGDLVASAVLEEIFLMIAQGVDIFELVDKAIVYLEHQKMTFELKATRDFKSLTIEKALMIKRHIGIEIALSNMIKIAENSNEVEYICKIFVRAIGEMVITDKVNDQYKLAADTITNAST